MINEARAALSGRADRLIAIAVLVLIVAGTRSWFAAQPWPIAGWTAAGVGALIGAGVERLVMGRLAFHGSDGVLAAEALHALTRRRYRLACHVIGLALLAAITLLVGLSLLAFDAPAYLAGVLAGNLIGHLGLPARIRGAWSIRVWLGHPVSGIAGATILLLSLAILAPRVGANALIAVAGITAVALALALTAVDVGVVRFMTLTGHGLWRILARHIRSGLTFIVVSTPVAWLAFDFAIAGAVAAAGFAVLWLTTVRILAYRLHDKRFADLFASILTGVMVLAAVMVPVALPVLAIGILWHLARRGAAKTWLLV